MQISRLFMGLAIAFLVAAGGNDAFAGKKKTQLTFAAIQTEDMAVVASRWEPMIKYLSKKVDVEINYYSTTSYSAVIEAMLSGFVQIAQLGPKAYLIANEKSNGRVQPLVAAARVPTAFDPTPCACYYGTLITKKGSKLTKIDQLKGKILALVDPGSTSGNAMPRGLFTVEKLDSKPLESHFGRIFYSGTSRAGIDLTHTHLQWHVQSLLHDWLACWICRRPRTIDPRHGQTAVSVYLQSDQHLAVCSYRRTDRRAGVS